MPSYQNAYKKRKRIYGAAFNQGKSDAATALRIARATAKLINVEFKSFDHLEEGTITNLPNAATFVLSNITQGDTAQQRDGNSVRLKSLLVNWNLRIDASGNPNQPCRSVIFIDWQNTGEDPALAGEVLENTGTTSNDKMTALPAILSDPGRFTILYDKTYNLNNTAGGGNRTFEFYSKKDYHLKFESTGGDAQRKGSIWMAVYTNATSDTPAVTVQSRIRYLDN